MVKCLVHLNLNVCTKDLLLNTTNTMLLLGSAHEYGCITMLVLVLHMNMVVLKCLC